MRNENYLKYAWVLVCMLLVIGTFAARGVAQEYPNTITFENQSGDNAVVKLVGPVRLVVPVPDMTNQTVHVPPGTFYILTRYCNAFGACTYSKGNPFTVEQTMTTYSIITITLHKVPWGNYATYPTTAAEFNQN